MDKLKFLWDYVLDDSNTPWWLFKIQHRVIVKTEKGFELKHWDELKWLW